MTPRVDHLVWNTSEKGTVRKGDHGVWTDGINHIFGWRRFIVSFIYIFPNILEDVRIQKYSIPVMVITSSQFHYFKVHGLLKHAFVRGLKFLIQSTQLAVNQNS